MTINSITGTIARALPTADGLEVKVAGERGSVTLTVKAARNDDINTLRAARMTGERITVRYDEDLVVLGTAAAVLARAA